MPKVASTSRLPSVTTASFAGNNPNVLKRNQACHQCRRRKLKCDAKRPCSTCVRSHAHAVAHASPDSNVPAEPDCTFDELPETTVTAAAEPPRNRYEKLENRINELEFLLRQKDAESNRSNSVQVSAEQSPDDSSSDKHPMPTAMSQPVPNFSDLLPGDRLRPEGSTSTQYQENNGTNGHPSLSPPQEAFITAISPSPPPRTKSTASEHYSQEILWNNWPPNLPAPDLLRHLVEVFFAFHPNASRLLHMPTFMASLKLPPTHSKFPIPPLLHAICAIASLNTGAVTTVPHPVGVSSDEIFLNKHRVRDSRPDTFAETQARCAKETFDRYHYLGDSLLSCLQAHIILTWYYWTHSKWVETFTSSGASIRLIVPLGLNVCAPFNSISRPIRAPSLLPPARTILEDETRRNAFWLAYAMERQHGVGNAWALSLDDLDVTQLLPVRGDQFERGELVNPDQRQWACTKNVLLVHPTDQTDSFILYIKSTILLSHVKNFNLRFRRRFYGGDPDVATSIPTPTIPLEQPLPGCGIDPRTTPEFHELDRIVASFRASFPPHLRDPIVNNVVDSHLYTTCLVPHVCTILLHEPHAAVKICECISATKILTASRAILDLIYVVMSTSFDITLLDLFCTLCWFMAGRVLVRFLQAALDAQSTERIQTLQAELEFVRLAMNKFGERIPLAYRYARMLDDLISRSIGPIQSLSAETDIGPMPDPPEANGTSAKDSFSFGQQQMSVVETNYFGGMLETQFQLEPLPPPQ
ncbi:hypothetical protein PLICRDRAFT_35780 [Plicaturopsis crispa FD-325 SS-3]|nr:hypothetical protein PLICRDRAFT_35780 [Plicaturopsis crispa FD-325 SS-3]